MPAPTRPPGSLRFPARSAMRCDVAIVVGEQRESALEQRNRGRHVLAPERSPSRGRQQRSPPRPRAPAPPRRPGRARCDSGTPARGGSRGSRRARRSPCLPEPATGATARSARGARRAPPWACPRTSRRRSASDGSDTRPPRQLGARRLHEPLADEAHELARHVRLVGVRREVDDGARPELLPDDRRALERPSLGRVEAVDARGEKRMNRRRAARSRRRASSRRSSPRAARRRADCPRRSR